MVDVKSFYLCWSNHILVRGALHTALGLLGTWHKWAEGRRKGLASISRHLSMAKSRYTYAATRERRWVKMYLDDC